MKLKEQQENFWQLITDAEEVKADQDLSALLLPNSRLTAPERLNIYANMYFYRLLDSLADTFETTKALLGEDKFHDLVTAYLAECPSRHFSVDLVGQFLPEFVKSCSEFKDAHYLSDVVHFEWQLQESFFAKDQGVLTNADLEDLSPEQWPPLVLTLCDHVKFSTYPFEVREAVISVKGDKSVKIVERQNHVLVYRIDGDVYHREVSETEFLCLEQFKQQQSFDEVCAFVAKRTAHPEPMMLLTQALKKLLEDQVFVGFESL